MSQDNVNRLPIEILCDIFDLLSFEDQQTAVLACVRWSDALTSERYLMQRRVKIDLEIIADSANAEALLRYRAFSVADDKIAVDNLKTIRGFLMEQLVEHAEELRLDLSRYTWPEFFAPRDELYTNFIQGRYTLTKSFIPEDKLCFPRLKKFSLTTHTSKKAACDQVHKWLVAPELKEMLLEGVAESNVQLVQLFSEQLELLDIKITNTKFFPAIFVNCKFENLRSLTISRLRRQDFQRNNLEFSSTQKDILARLTSLELNDWYMVSRKSILQAACNLETLTIKDSFLSDEEFSQIAKMIGLKELCLMIEFGGKIGTTEKLSLPHLEKLTTLSTLVPLGNFPKLRQLSIANCSLGTAGKANDEMQIDSFLKKCNQQVERLTFHNMSFKTNFIDQICTMSNLRSLELHKIVMELDDVRKVCQSLNRRGQIIRLERCVLAHEIPNNYNYFFYNYDKLIKLHSFANSLERAKVFFRELISQYPDHRISQMSCRKVDFIEDGEDWENFDLERLKVESSSDN